MSEQPGMGHPAEPGAEGRPDDPGQHPAPSRRHLLLGGLGLLGFALPAAAEAAITAARLDRHEGGARLSLEADSATRWRLSATTRPARLVLALPGSAWRGPARLAGVGPVRAARWDAPNRRLLIDLAGPVSVRRAAVEGGRLLVEIGPGTQPGFARLARGAIGEGRFGSGAATAAAPARNLPLIVLDPGHGGKDPGTIGVAGTYEKRITLAAALELKRQLEAGGRCRVALTRSRDVFIPLDGRVDFARRREAALFISLHADSAPGARGASVYTLGDRASDALAGRLAQSQNRADAAGGLRIPDVSPEVQRILFSLVRQETRVGSARMARFVVDSLDRNVTLLPNTHRQASFAVLKAPDVPSVLVEMGFLSDRRDEAALNRPAHRTLIARCLTQAIHGWVAQHHTSVLGRTG
ncbi:N-acetylmuramoyl-L-alanine amidase [Pseudoroseomonas cervicalis]|uniref:N-acetylmuramoyl-L-alanine amidase n=1 Tax=Teichococcus cervicalis TaxID=204525 RepID=UPI002782D97D|nr:N-acetylmuramoyl-L-alanine amidase [Pseudoroseomonas cervicalis]MDQ1080168.1 N-acetylmuramoyl-L-alanine amidase [Pseudoroseomonas cervicalis]